MEESTAHLTETAENFHNHGWQKVVNPKRQRKSNSVNNAEAGNVFRSVEQHAEDWRKRAIEGQKAALDAAEFLVTPSLMEDTTSDEDGEAKNLHLNGDEKKPKLKKPKKPKVTVAEAAAKINAADLSAFLADVSGSYENAPDIQLMRFADYFARAFSAVTASQFPWMKIFKESPVQKIIDIPLNSVSEDVYRTSIEWIGYRPTEALSEFVLLALDSILVDLAAHQGTVKGSKKTTQPPSTKAQVAIFLALAMVLRRRPESLSNLMPTLKAGSKYQAQDRLPVLIWAIGQATERFEAAYPFLKELALAGIPGSKAMKQVAAQLSVSLSAINKSNPEVSQEAAGIFIWCLSQSAESYKHWEKVYADRIEASAVVLAKLVEGWKELSSKFSPYDNLRQTIKSLQLNNEEALNDGETDADRLASFKNASKLCNVLSAKLAQRGGCLKTSVVILAVGVAAYAVASSNSDAWEDLKRLSVSFIPAKFYKKIIGMVGHDDFSAAEALCAVAQV